MRTTVGNLELVALASCVALAEMIEFLPCNEQITVRDTYVLTGSPRVVSLKDNLIIVVCKTECDAWLRDQKPPALSLYMNGLS